MISRIFPALFLLFFSAYSFSQDVELLNANSIPLELLTNANAVVRYNDISLDISAYNRMTYTNQRAVTILNSSGNSKHRASVSYDDNVNIRKLEARVYNASGEEIKKIKKNDFEDVSAVDGFSLYLDNRIKYLNYTPIDYPYTVVFETEITYSSTAGIHNWRPIEGYYTSTENSSYTIVNSSEIELKIKADNFDDYGIEEIDKNSFKATNLKSIKPEAYSPPFKTYAPFLKATLSEFDMEGVRGMNNNWKDFGKWVNDKLIKDTQELPLQVKEEITDLTANAKTDIEKAKIVYEYMQNKTRYVSVQVGIGGWKPMQARDVDRLGYGDCKGLSNYTKAMLNHIGVNSYYTLIYGGREITNFDKEFSRVEGNHAILAVPNGDDYVWLECTSQTSPFGYNAGFTDDRDALIITPEGGKILHTKEYKTEDNLQFTKANVLIDEEGNISGNIDIKSSGYQYSFHQGIENKTQKDQKLHYKEYWDNINNLSIEHIELVNDKDKILYTEKIKVSAKDYGSKSGDRLLIQPNMFNKITSIPTRYSERKQDFEIDRGFTDKDEFVIEIAPELSVEAMPKPVLIETKFGSYVMRIEKNTDNQLIYKRTYILNKGYYDKSEYADFRKFKRNVVKHDKAKIVLITKT